jgi:phosphoribosylformylglycinamidine synthase
VIDKKLINSAHDVSEGGILTCIAECCILDEENLIGAEVNIPVKTREDFSFFSESQSRVVVSVSPEKREQFEKLIADSEVKAVLLGSTGGKDLVVNDEYKFEVKNLADIYYNSISRIMSSAEEI